MKALVGTFNQEKALVGAFSVIVKTGCGTDGALHSTIGRLATFQQQLGPVVAQFENVCGAEGKFNVDSISAIGDLILKMSDLFGNGDTATTRGASYVNNVVVRRCYYFKKSWMIIFIFNNSSLNCAV